MWTGRAAIALALGTVLVVSGCGASGKASAEAMLRDIVAAAERDEPTLRGESAIRLNDRVVLRQETWLDGARLTTLPQSPSVRTHATADGASLLIGWSELAQAAEEVKIVPNRSGGTVTLHVRLQSDASKRLVVRYLEQRIAQVRRSVTEQLAADARIERHMAGEEAKLRDVLDTLEAATEYVITADADTAELRRLDVRTLLRYNKEGSAIEERIEGTYEAALPELQEQPRANGG